MTIKNAVYNFLKTAYPMGQTFTTRDVAKRLSYSNADVSAALSQLRINDRKIVRDSVIKDAYGTVMNVYKLDTSPAAMIARGTPENRYNGFVEAVKAQNGLTGTTLADKLAGLVAPAAPVKSLADYSDDELFNEIKRRLT